MNKDHVGPHRRRGVRRGQALCLQQIRAAGETSEYEMNEDDAAAAKRVKARFGGAALFTMRMGYQAAYRLGGSFLANGS